MILGAHYDSWTHGAVDNVSGTVALLEAARVLARQAAAGNRPDRSLVFAAWDAEEWGLIGSTEWVEEYAQQLEQGAVAYINLDGIAGGPYFSAVASPSLRALLYAGASAIADPVLPGASVYSAWLERTPGASVGLPGGGSDYAPFTAIAGVPAIGFGFSAASGVYHSAHDTIDFMERFGDPGYRQHRAAASLAVWLLWRLGNDRTVAFDYRPLAQVVVSGLSAVQGELDKLGYAHGVPGLTLAWSAVGKLAQTAGVLHARLAAAATIEVPERVLRQVNAHMRRAHRRLTRVRNGAGSSTVWGRSVLVAPDPQDTYSSLLSSADSQFPAARRCWWNRARVARTGLESRGRCRRINGRRAGSAAGAPCRCDRGPIAFCHGAARYICRQKKARRSPRAASLWHAPGHGFEPA